MENRRFDFKKIILKCKDNVEIILDFQILVKFDIEPAQKLNWRKFKRRIEDYFLEIIHKSAAEKSVEELLSKNFPKIETEIKGVAVKWDGRLTYWSAP